MRTPRLKTLCALEIMIAFLAVLLLCLFALLARAQDAPPKLTDKVHAEVRDLQLKLSLTNQQLLQLQQQYAAVEQQGRAIGTELQARLKTALKDAGIDDTVWELDPETLAVKARPAKEKGKP